MTTKPELLAEINSAWDELQAALARFTNDQLSSVRDPQGWAAKDHLSHLADWERSVASVLKGQPRHEGLGVSEDLYLNETFDEINDVLFEVHKDFTLQEVIARLSAGHQELLKLVEERPEAELQKPYRALLPGNARYGDDRSAMALILANTAEHYREHLVWMEELLAAKD